MGYILFSTCDSNGCGQAAPRIAYGDPPIGNLLFMRATRILPRLVVF